MTELELSIQHSFARMTFSPPRGVAPAAPAARRPGFFDEVPKRLHSLYSNTQEENDELLGGAARFGDAFACSVLIGNGANVNCVNNRGWSPLHEVVSYHTVPNPDCVRFLLRAGALVNKEDVCVKPHGQRGWTPLHLAIAHGKCTAVKMLLRAGAKFIPELPHHGRTVQSSRAWILFDGWEKYVRQRKRKLAVFVAKLAPLPDDAARLVVDFYFGAVGYVEASEVPA